MPIFALEEEVDIISLTSEDDARSDGIMAYEPSSESINTYNNQTGIHIRVPASSYSSSFNDSNFLGTGSYINQTMRRKSSVYRRLSIRSVNSVEINSTAVADSYEESYLKEAVAVAKKDAKEKIKVDDFEPVKILGQGAYGKVYLVKHKSTGKLFAQKQLKKASLTIGREMERTIAEKEILSKLNHPNIVKLFYALHDERKVYLFLEYIPGGELFMHLATKKFLSEDVTAFYAAEMTLALKHLHDIGIVYRDLKPENCLLDKRGHLVLTDFGLSKAADREDADEGFEKCTSIIGTPEYMAPEVLKGEEYGFQVDWWSLGTVIYDMMTGKPPFTGGNHKTITNKILKNKVTYQFYFSQDAKDLLNKLLNKNPEKRFNVDEDFEKFKKHRFFRKVDWDKLIDQNHSLEPPIVPIITDPILAENFDHQFTSMKISDYDANSTPSAIDIQSSGIRNDLFKDFSYTASGSYLDRFLA